MILCAEHGLHFTHDGDHWRCVELPDVMMLRGERYRVGEQTFGSLDLALRYVAENGTMQAAQILRDLTDEIEGLADEQFGAEGRQNLPQFCHSSPRKRTPGAATGNRPTP